MQAHQTCTTLSTDMAQLRIPVSWTGSAADACQERLRDICSRMQQMTHASELLCAQATLQVAS